MLLFWVSAVGILSAPSDECKTWLTDFITSKIIGFTAAYLLYRLYKHFDAEGTIPELSGKAKEED